MLQKFSFFLAVQDPCVVNYLHPPLTLVELLVDSCKKTLYDI